MDEHLEQVSAEQHEPEPEPDQDDQAQRRLTQRELVRASLLRCPPAEPDPQPHR